MMTLRFSYAVLTVSLVFSLVCLFERPAYAYIDPGSGILACQALSAFFAGTVYYFRQRVKRLFGSFHK
jgi:hypothetical protein